MTDILKVTLNRMKILAYIAGVLNGTLFILDLFTLSSQKCSESSFYCYAVTAIHLYGFIMSLVYLPIHYFYMIKPDKPVRTRRFILVSYLLITLIAFDGLGIARFSELQTLSSLIVGLFVIAFLFNLRKRESFILFLLNLVIIISGLLLFRISLYEELYHFLIVIVSTVFALFINISISTSERARADREKQLAEKNRELEISEQNARHMFEASPYPKVVTEFPSGRVFMYNDRLLELFEIPSDSTIDFYAPHFYADPSDRDVFIKELREKGRVSAFEVRIVTYTGVEKWVAISSEFIEINGIKALITGFMDISARKQQELELQQSRQRAEELARHRSEFLANMSHEIRTPMNAVLGMTRLLKESDIDSDQRRIVHSLENAGTNLVRILNDILDLSRIESGEITIKDTAFSIEKLLETLEAIYRYRAEGENLELRFSVSDSLPGIFSGDHDRIVQILGNLLSNALKFTEEGGVYLNVTGKNFEDSDQWLISFSVRDTGAGISEDKIDKLFDRFTQGDPYTSRKHGGSGLGLAIALKLADIMKGSLTVSSTPGQGSEFILTLPLKQVTAIDRDDQQQNYIPLPAREFNLLVAEDSADNRFLIERFLNEKRLKLSFAENGQKTVDLFREGDFDLILMDIQMPELNGYEALREIRQYEKEHNLPQTPAVALTAFAMKSDVDKSLEHGFKAHLAKPFTKEALVHMVSALLNNL